MRTKTQTERRSSHRARQVLMGGALMLGLAGSGRGASPSSPNTGTPLSSTVVGAQGVKLSVLSEGPSEGTSIVFIHGFLSDKSVWTKQFTGPTLATFHLVAYDWRGSGQSDKPQDPAAYMPSQVWAEDLQAVIRTTHANRPVLVAWSMGSNVVLDYLRTYGDAQISGIVLIGSALNTVDPATQAQFRPTGQQTLQAMFSPTATGDEASHRFVAALTAMAQPPAVTASLLAAVTAVPLVVRLAQATRPIGDPLAELRALSIPVLLVQGGQDQFLKPTMLAHDAALFNAASATLYPDSGHALQLDAPDQFNRELARFARP